MKLKVMLVDDEPNILRNLQTVVPWEELGFEVAALAKSGVEALEKAAEAEPDLVLSDIRMPLMDGISFVKALRENNADCEILMVTGYQEFEYVRTLLRYGVTDYILKPIDYEGLARTIRELAETIRAKHPAAARPFEGGKKHSEQLMDAAMTYIHAHYATDFGIEDISGRLGISCSYFSLLFKQHYGETFLEYLTRHRMETAQAMLLRSDRSVTDIGRSVGFTERRYFSKVFQKYTGEIPSEYREKRGWRG